MRIAIIDNDRAFLRSLELLLTGYSHEVSAFTNPSDALEIIGSSPTPDVVMSDYRMPEMNGSQLLAQLQKRNIPRTILMSAHTDVLSGTDINSFGADHFIAKPIDLTRLLALLEKIQNSIHGNSGVTYE